MLALALIAFTFCGCSFLWSLFPSYNVNEYAEAITQTALNYLQNVFVNELTDEQMIQAALNGANQILQTYDNYGYFLTPQQLYDLENPQPAGSDGKFFGFTYVQIQYVGLYITSVVVDSQAYWQGLKAGDLIVGITQLDGSPLTYQEEEQTKTLDVRLAELSALKSRLGLEAGSDTYKFTVIRNATSEQCFEDGETGTLEIRRSGTYNDNQNESNSMYFVEYYGGKKDGVMVGNVSSKTVALRSLSQLDGSNVGYIRILEFSKYEINGKKVGTSDEVERALKALKAAGKTKIIIDLQDNPGGSVSEVVGVASFFITKPLTFSLKVASLEDREGNSEDYTATVKYSSYFNGDSGNIVVLTNANSASGSEMLLGAILDYGTGVHVGSTTFGKGIAQSYDKLTSLTGKAIDVNGNEITYNYGIYLTIAYYYSPNHINIHGVGYTPQQENIITDYQSQMQRALDLLSK